ncbi:restriction endonuclease [Nannocystis radixulma]|uniref:Restriction endonuclease n=1 Tax=Nannocystis radixulma TaxID=2995305 RepID=A0ABT5BKS0_9BACT|nr:restriction endonuclease [Nannocystis radixulma]MDC0673627.1 restriction endonuclease [Nannocystis radixulma]
MTAKSVEYERLVRAIYGALLQQDSVQNIEVLHNTRLVGKSGATHQIDVMWRFSQAGLAHTVVVECKDCGRPREKSEIAEFKGVLDDLHGRPRGIFVSRSGFQDGALKFAAHHDIELMELRPPNDDDWNDELRGFRIKFHFRQRSYDVHGVTVDEDLARKILRERGVPKGTEISFTLPTYPGRDLDLYDIDGNPIGSLVKCLDRVTDVAEATIGSCRFDLPTFIKIAHPLLPLCPIKAMEFSYVVHIFENETQIDFKDLVKAVLKNVRDGTQIRFDHELRPRRVAKG